MKKISFFVVFGLFCLLLLGQFSSMQAAPMGTAFSYQGSLSDKGQPANGIYDVICTLYDAAIEGSIVGSPITLEGLIVSKGHFTAWLDFGSGIFDGAARWLEFSIRPQNQGSHIRFNPRQALTPTPYALYADSFSGKLSGNKSSGAILSVTNTFSGTYPVSHAIFASASANNAPTIWATALGTSASGIFGGSDGTNGVGVSGMSGYYDTNGTGVSGATHPMSTGGTGVSGVASGTGGTGVRGYGALFDFYAAGPGANYAPFTGSHEARLSEDFSRDIKPGMIVSVTGQTRIRSQKNGTPSLSSTLPTIKLSTQAADKAVFGVLVAEGPLPKDHWYLAKEGERFATVNALGEGRVWVSNINGAIEVGDYITTSAIPGYGQRQADDLLHSYTLGKAIETVDWDSVSETVIFNGQAVKVYLIAVVYTSG